EIGAVTYMAAKNENSPALLFENLEGKEERVPVLANILGASQRRFAMAVGLDPESTTRQLILAMREKMKQDIPPVQVPAEEAPVNERILLGDEIDMTILPAARFWPGDGGEFIGTGDITLTSDPISGRINVGVYRQQLHGPRRIGMYCSPGKHARLDREQWWARGEDCEVVCAYGIDPVLFMVGQQSYAFDRSELGVAGGLMGRPLELAPGAVGSLPIPARAEIVIEGILQADDMEMEGPLGEVTGYYGNPPAPQPVIQVKALHMRHEPILTAALMADYPASEVGAYYAIMRSAGIWEDLERMGITGIHGVWSHPAAAAGFGMVVVSLEQKYAGHASQVLALTAQCPSAAYFTKWVVAVDEDVDPTDFNQVLWAMSTRCHPADDLDLQRQTWSTGTDPSQGAMENRAYGSKALINACKPHKHLASFPERTIVRRSVRDRVAERWDELGLDGTPPDIVTLDE
ncbi:MAG: UbiD family decarboxylase, partial [Rhodospirillales bacterium]|nr:UbiD family decarboxylase [Rhodospirillales bacterium]